MMLVGPVSTWLQANSWATAQASPIRQFITEQISVNATLANAQSDYLLGTAGLAANAAAARLHAQRKAQPTSVQTLIAAAGKIIDRLA